MPLPKQRRVGENPSAKTAGRKSIAKTSLHGTAAQKKATRARTYQANPGLRTSGRANRTKFIR